MKEPVAPAAPTAAPVIRAETNRASVEPQATAVAERSAAQVSELRSAGDRRHRSIRKTFDLSGPGIRRRQTMTMLEEMVKGASVLRVKTEAPATGKLPFDADTTRQLQRLRFAAARVLERSAAAQRTG